MNQRNGRLVFRVTDQGLDDEEARLWAKQFFFLVVAERDMIRSNREPKK